MKSLVLSLLLATAGVTAVAQTAPLTYEPPTQSRVLGTTFIDWDALTAVKTDAGERRDVFDNPTPTLEKFEVHATTLRPGGQSHPEHRHPWEEIILVKEGELSVSINGHKQHAGPGYFLFFAANDAHAVENVGKTPATYYAITFYTDLVHTVGDKSAAEQAVAGKLASSVIDCNSLKTTPTASGARVVVVSSPTLTFLALESHITTLNEGQSTTPEMIDLGDEFLWIKTGAVDVTTNGVTARMKEGSVLYWAPGDKRGLRNVGTGPASYEVIRVTSAKSPKAAGG